MINVDAALDDDDCVNDESLLITNVRVKLLRVAVVRVDVQSFCRGEPAPYVDFNLRHPVDDRRQRRRRLFALPVPHQDLFQYAPGVQGDARESFQTQRFDENSRLQRVDFQPAGWKAVVFEPPQLPQPAAGQTAHLLANFVLLSQSDVDKLYLDAMEGSRQHSAIL